MRTIEPLLFEHRIALVITGHVHGEGIIGDPFAKPWFLLFFYVTAESFTSMVSDGGAVLVFRLCFPPMQAFLSRCTG